MTGKLPITEKLLLECNKDQWRILTSGLINELNTSAIIERSPGHKVRVQLVISNIFPPEDIRLNTHSHVIGNFGEKFANGLKRSYDYLDGFLKKSTWIMIGYINGEEKSPIIITYIESINIFIYSIKLKEEANENFFPMSSKN